MFEAGNSIELNNPDTKGTKTFIVHTAHQVPVSGEGVVKATGTLIEEDGSTKDTHPLVFKRPIRVNTFMDAFDQNGRLIYPLAYYKVWDRLKDTPLHCIDEVLIAQEKHVAMTDLTAKTGGKFYGNAEYHAVLWSVSKPEERDTFFVNLSMAEIERKTRETIICATDLKIELSQDDPLHLFLLPDHSFSIMPLDLGEIHFDIKDPYAYNRKYMETFITRIKHLQHLLAKE